MWPTTMGISWTPCARRVWWLVGGACTLACSTPRPPAGEDVSYTFPDIIRDIWFDASTPCNGPCAERANSVGTCDGGTCVYVCAPGFLDCDGDASNGCEANSATSSSHCGSCAHACPVAANSFSQCVDAVCTSVCNQGWADCAPGPDGCETATDSATDHCGGCTTSCTTGPHAAAVCESGSCGLKCDTGYADCNGSAGDGCEVEIASDPLHCGACGLSCNGVACLKGACVCASTSTTATFVPLDMYIMMDQSKSMSEATGTPNISKWQAIYQALSAYVNDTGSSGIGVAIQFFGLPAPGTKGSSCIASDYATPAVALAPLPGSAGAIANAVAAHGPTGMTPTAPALQGAIDYAKSYATSHPGHTVIAVLATDGQPTECSPTDIPSIANLAVTGVSGTPKVLTFVIGVGTSLANLDVIAAGGGSKQAFLVDQGGNVVQQFQAALKAIQGLAIGCTYAIPEPTGGQPLDLAKVNVLVTANGTQALLTYVTAATACDPAGGGWHFDSPTTPAQIILCPASCSLITGDPKAEVDVLLGCARAPGG